MVARQLRIGRLFELDSLVEITQRARPLSSVQVLASEIHLGASPVERRRVRRERNRPAELFERLIRLPLLEVDLRQYGESLEPGFVETDGGQQVRLGGPEFFALEFQHTLIHKQRVAQIDAGLLFEQSECPAIVGRSRVELDLRLGAKRGFLGRQLVDEPPGAHPKLIRRESAEHIKPCLARLELEASLEAGLRLGELLAPQAAYRSQAFGPELTGLELERGVERTHRLAQLAAFVSFLPDQQVIERGRRRRRRGRITRLARLHRSSGAGQAGGPPKVQSHGGGSQPGGFVKPAETVFGLALGL